MQDCKTSVKTALNRILSAVTSENFFVWLVGGVILTFWALDIWVIGMVVLCVMMALSLALCKDTARILSVLFMIIMVLSANRHTLGGMTWLLIISIGLLITGIIIHIIRFRPKFKPLFTKGKVKGFSFALILLIIPAVLGGVGRGDRNIAAYLVAIGYFTIVPVCYLFFLATTSEKKSDAMLRYVILMMFVAGIVMVVQMSVYYYRLGSYEAFSLCVKQKTLDLGWACGNNVGPMLGLALPASFYYAVKSKKFAFLFIILAFIEYAFIFTTACRGAILFTSLAMPFMLCYTVSKAENKLMVGLSISLTVCVIIVIIAYYGGQFVQIFQRMLSLGLDGNGRTEIYELAIDTFKEFPIFGAGWDYRLGELANDGYTPYWYHCTILQIMADMGIIGLIFYSVFAFWRYRSCLTVNYTLPKLTIGAGMLIFELYGMIDVVFFGPTFFITMVIMSFAIEKSLDENQCNPVLFKLLGKIKRRKVSN